MIDLVKPIAEQLAFNASLFALAFDDVSNTEAVRPPANGGTTLHWVAAHVVTGRHHTLHLLNKKTKIPWEGQYESSVAIEDQSLVATERIVSEWDRVTRLLMPALATASERLLHTAPATPFPTIEQSTLSALAFMANHEAYHVGQLSYVRRQLGKTPLMELLLAQAS